MRNRWLIERYKNWSCLSPLSPTYSPPSYTHTHTAFSMLSTTASVFLLYANRSEVYVVIMLCLFRMVSTPAWNDSSLIIAEVYPTHLRSTAMGVHLLMARIGAILGTNIFGEFVYVNPAIPIFLMASVLFVGGIAAIPLPKTTRKTLLT